MMNTPTLHKVYLYSPRTVTRLSPRKILVHVVDPPLDVVFVRTNSTLDRQVFVGSFQLPVEEAWIMLPLRLLLLLGLLCPVLAHPARPLVIPPLSVGHHLRQLGLLLGVA